MHIVLHEPEIPQNTGSISRTCLLTDTKLHLIRPLGFSIEEKYLLRSGLDYWSHLDVQYYDNFEHFVEVNNNPLIFMSSTKGMKLYTEFKYPVNAYIMFGKESAGIPRYILDQYRATTLRIPMCEKVRESRSLNLSNAVSIVLYEALRQNDFNNMG